jgi:hypothetical protein
MAAKTNYVIQTDIKFGAMEKIDIGAIEKACAYDWFNQILCQVNDALVLMVEAATVTPTGDAGATS